LVKFTPFLRTSDYMQIKFECVCPTPLRNLYYTFFFKYIIILLIRLRNLYCTFFFQIYHNFINNFSSRHQGGGADTLKFNLHIIGSAKKGYEFNQKRCEFKILLFIPYLAFATCNHNIYVQNGSWELFCTTVKVLSP